MRRPFPRSLSLRTVLVATLALPLLTSTAFGVAWARDRQREADHAELVANQIDMLSELSQLQFRVETQRLFRGLNTSLLPPEITSATAGDSSPRARSLWEDGRQLLDRSATLDSLTEGKGAKTLRRVIGRHDAAVADPDLPTINDDLTRSAADLRHIIDMIRADADVDAVLQTAVFDQFSQLQALMLVEAQQFIAAVGQGVPSAASVLDIYRTGARQDALIAQIRPALDPDLQRQFLDDLAGVDMEALRDSIAVNAGISVGPSFADTFTPERLSIVQHRYAALPEIRGELADRVTAESNAVSEQAQRWSQRAMLVALALAAMTLAAATAISRVVIRRLRMVAEAASRIGDGDIDHDPLPATGPREIRDVTVAFNRMSDLLLTLDHQVSAIGIGEIDDPWLDKTLPGHIGSQIQQSVRLIATTNEQLRAAQALANAIIDAAVDAIITVDAGGIITSTNPAAERLAGAAPGQLEGRRLSKVFVNLPSFERLIDHDDSIAVPLIRHSGDTVPTLVSAREIHGRDGSAGRAFFIRDISERAAWEERFRFQATHDELTQLPNRFALREYLQTLTADIDDRRSVAMLCVGIDRFKYVNEAHGLHNGDHAMQLIAERLLDAVGDAYVARLGGDEFAVVTRNVREDEGLQALANSLRATLATPIEFNDERLTLESCVGIAVVDDGVDGTDQLLRFADVALSIAKDAGPGSVRIYDEGMSDLIERRTRLEQRLRTALATDQLEMFAQPIVDLQTEHIGGVELLARWRHEGEWISPEVFIPIAEESGLIQALGRWGMSCACDLLSELQAAGCPQTVSVNISGLHLMGGDVAAELAALLNGTTFDRSRLRIELTESFLLDDPEVAAARLDEIRALGAQIVIDDFGTGYSSLTYLHALPIDGLKLDGSFVSRLGTDENDETIVRLVNDLAEGLHLDLVAEGIETIEQQRALIDHGYRKGQGYLWSKPVPIRELWPLIQQPADAVAEAADPAPASAR